MPTIHISSIRDAVTNGTLIDLASDYRTSQTVRACLPRSGSYPFAISTAAYRKEVERGAVGDQRSRMELICSFLSKLLGRDDRPTGSKLEFRFPAQSGQLDPCALKLEWFAANQYWVILLPDEQIQSSLRPA